MATEDKSKTDSIIANLMGYIDTRIDLVKLDLQTKLKSIFVSTVHGVLLGLVGLMVLLFLNIFLALLLNDLLDSRFWGFGIITLFYLILLVILIVGLDKKVFQGMADKAFRNTIYKTDESDQTI
ncbi:phage holin family protein [Rufibacter latericius]|uniref:Phage holin family protein n=1 Tax=Rufibacter latericius TaxID=2487040 RepID=A0A3M9MN11_9BACT|nr:phage holin family protein [Rufibacter latericius]RNI26926.1 phage holin family protein [Rufibacter latericius]